MSLKFYCYFWLVVAVFSVATKDNNIAGIAVILSSIYGTGSEIIKEIKEKKL